MIPQEALQLLDNVTSRIQMLINNQVLTRADHLKIIEAIEVLEKMINNAEIKKNDK